MPRRQRARTAGSGLIKKIRKPMAAPTLDDGQSARSALVRLLKFVILLLFEHSCADH